MSLKPAHQQVLDKLDWAEKHIQKLNAALRVFHDAHPVHLLTKTESDTGELTYYVGEVPKIPSHIPLITGDVLHSLRGALDFLACGIVPVVTKDTKFPIGHSAQAYKSSLGRLVPGLNQAALKVLDSVKPYDGGNITLSALHRLNNIDKHRLLLTACTISPTHHLTPEEIAVQDPLGPSDIPFTFPTGERAVLRFSNKGLPVSLHAGQKLLTVANTEANQNVRFFFAVALEEPGISEGLPLDMLLRFMYFEVQRVINKLAMFIVR